MDPIQWWMEWDSTPTSHQKNKEYKKMIMQVSRHGKTRMNGTLPIKNGMGEKDGGEWKLNGLVFLAF